LLLDVQLYHPNYSVVYFLKTLLVHSDITFA